MNRDQANFKSANDLGGSRDLSSTLSYPSIEITPSALGINNVFLDGIGIIF